MPFDPAKPQENTPLDAAEMRSQFNGLKAIIDDLQNQLAPLMPVLARSNAGVWTLAYTALPVITWQVWVRSPLDATWSVFGEIDTSQFPANDDLMTPGGVWWQVKLVGENADGNPCTAFSNVVSFGPVPA